MSQPSRPRARGPSQQRRRRDLRPDLPVPLEERRLLAPVWRRTPWRSTFTAAPTPTNTDLGSVTLTASSASTSSTAAPITSVAELTPNSSFGGDIVNITPGPGGVFGNAVYAISRGAGGNTKAINRPGVIYRVDPATGKASVFFDLNTVISQTDPNTTTTPPAANSVGSATGLVNWYSMTFDPEGQFDGTPSLFVSSVDPSDPDKNIDLPDLAQRPAHRRLRPDDRRPGVAEVQHQPDGDPDPAGAGAAVPQLHPRERPGGRHRWDAGRQRPSRPPARSRSCISTRAPTPPARSSATPRSRPA